MCSVMGMFFASVMSQLSVPGPRYVSLRVMPGVLGLGIALGSTTPTALLATGGNANALVLRNLKDECSWSDGAYGMPVSRMRAPSPPPVMFRPLTLMVTD